MNKLLFLSLIFVMLTACAPDPRREAEAYAIQSEAEQKALDAERARNTQVELDRLTVENTVIETGHKEATKAEWRRGLNNAIKYGFIFFTVGLCVSLLVLSYSISRASIGISNAVTQGSMVRANLIRLDPVTRQYPLLVNYVGKGRYSLTDPNTATVMMLDTRQDGDRQMIAGAMNTRQVGALAMMAKEMQDASAMPMIEPTEILSSADIKQIIQGEVS